ncbi:lipid A core--O-antigen ligase [Ensifer sp. Root423]|uniref:O-antigen ligase family protein n=1 Tax=Ensifer sp. Root423 TaxID=1736534 RepID=UPI00071463F5|nr:O-antigen ligase family protein [Ensifer sp. Root423]KQX27809.1 lipid A core--O-antigen ligase [Ensifer sp. Root423]
MTESNHCTAPHPCFPRRARTLDIHLSAIERGVVYLAVFLAPYATLRISDLFFTVSDLLFCVSLFLLIILRKISKRPLDNLTGPWIFAFMLLLIGMMVGSLVHGRPDRGIVVMAQYFFAYLILMLVLIRSDTRETYRLAAIFLFSVLLIDLHGIITFYTVGYVPSDGKGVVTGGKRLATMLRNPNLAAAINALTLPILLYFWSSGRLRYWIAVPAVVLVVGTVVLTSSNSGLFVTAISLIVFVALISTRRLVMRLSLTTVLVVAALAIFGSKDMLPQTFQKRVLGALSSGDIAEAGTFASRAELMQEALQIVSDDKIWLVGIGADQFRERSVQDAPVHNLYLLLWAEGGLVALFGWLMFAAVGFLLWLAVKRGGGDKYAAAAVLTTIAALLTIALSNPHMYARYWTIPVFLTFGLALVRLKRTHPRPDRSIWMATGETALTSPGRQPQGKGLLNP